MPGKDVTDDLQELSRICDQLCLGELGLEGFGLDLREGGGGAFFVDIWYRC